MATSPAYFRGFTLIALKEGREGTTDDDYTGQFQVRRRVVDREVLSAFWGSLQKTSPFARENARRSGLSCSLLTSGKVFLTDSTAPEI